MRRARHGDRQRCGGGRCRTWRLRAACRCGARMTPGRLVRIGLPEVALAACWIGIVIAFVALRIKSSGMVFADEMLPLKISEAMSARGDLDPNWRLADLGENFRYDQYNFYLYNIVAHFAIEAGGWLGRSAIGVVRHANVVFQLLALAFAIDALRRIGAGRISRVIAGALIAFAPGMVQDA